MPTIDEAQAFLKTALADGARAGDAVTREAAAKGIALETLIKARECLHITPKKVGTSWMWELPEEGVEVELDL